MKELIKLGYRMVGGFFVFIMTFPLAVAGFAISLAGAVVSAASIIPLAEPEMMSDTGITMISNQVQASEPFLVFLVLLAVGFILLGTGGLLLVSALLVVKLALYVDRELARAIDRTVQPARYTENPVYYNDYKAS